MRFLYVSRHFNRSGYSILQHLLPAGYLPVAVALPKPSSPQPLDTASTAPQEVERYLNEVRALNGRPLRFLKSIKLLAESWRIPVMELSTMKSAEALDRLKDLDIDLIVLGGGWHELLPGQIISLPRLGIINTHPSLLPEFRGTDVHRWQVFAGVRQSGVTIHYVDETFDTGDILGQAAVDIAPQDAPQDLFEKTAQVSGPLMAGILDRICNEAPARLQGIAQSSRNDRNHYYSRWNWEDPSFLRLDWERMADELVNFIRACSQESYLYNGPFTYFHGVKLLVREAEISEREFSGRTVPGQIVSITSKRLHVAAATGSPLVALRILQYATFRGWPEQPHRDPAFPAGELVQRNSSVPGDIFT